MSTQNLDPHSLKFFKNSTRPKRASSQVNGETRISQHTIIAKSNAKAHRW